MSCQRGNSNRSRSQKYKNHTAFKNNLHDTSHRTKFINNLQIANVCERCKSIIEWKIKYKKYKPLKAPSKCIKCEQKAVKHAYHNICLSCAKQEEICSKCGKKEEIIAANPSKEEQLKLDAEFKMILKTMSERKRRTFLRYMNQNSKKKNDKQNELNTDETDCKDISKNTCSRNREDLLLKLKSLAITEEEEEEDDDDDDDDDIVKSDFEE